MRFLVITTLFILSSTIAAQFPTRPNAYTADSLRNGEWITFYDSLGNEINRESPNVSHYCLMEIAHGKPLGQIECFYESGIRSWIGRMASIDPEIKQGRALGYHKNGALWSKAFYENDTIKGLYTNYYDNGILELEGQIIDGEKTGKWTYFYENGNMISTVDYIDGRENGLTTIYYENGNINSKGKLIDNIKEGYWETYFDSGVLANNGEYKSGEREGKWIYYHENGTVKDIGVYQQDEEEGNHKRYYENGQLETNGHYKGGLGAGYFEYFYQNGQLYSKGILEKDLYQGFWTFYHENGQKESEGNYIDDKKDGLWKYYFENGMLNKEAAYKNDKENGNVTYYYDNGVLNASGELVGGIKHGKWEYYHSNGILQGIENYKNGTLHGHTELRKENGQLINQGDYINGQQHGIKEFYHDNGTLSSSKTYNEGISEGPIISYFQNGIKSKEGQYANDQREGRWIYYHSNGELSAVGDYHQGNSTGIWKYYYDNGVLKKEGKEFADDHLGEWIFYDRSGRLSSRGSYTDGKLHGPHFYYDSLGNVSSEVPYINGVGQTFNNLYDSVDNLSLKGQYDKAEQTLEATKAAYYKYFEKNDLKKSDLYEIIATLARRKGDFKQSIKYIKKSLKNTLKYKSDTSIWYTDTLDDLGNTYTFMGEYEKALKVYEDVIRKIAARPHGKESNEYAQSFRYYAIALMNLKRYDEAIEILHEDQKFRQSLPNQKTHIAATHYNIVDACYSKTSSPIDSAIANSLKFHEKNDLKQTWTYAGTLYYKALIARDRKQLADAYQDFQSYIKISKNNADTIEVSYVNALIQLGNYHYRKLEYDQSRFYFQRAMAIAENPKIQKYWVYRDAVKSIAHQYWADDDFPNTLKYNQKMIDLAKSDGNTSRIGEGYTGLALVYDEMGSDFVKDAKENHLKAIEIFSSMDGYNDNYSNAILQYGNHLKKHLKYDEEMHLLKEMEQYLLSFEEVDTLFLFRTYHQMAQNFYNRYHYDSAEQYAQKIIDELKANPVKSMQEYFISFRTLGDVKTSLGRYDEAGIHYFKALEEVEKYLGKKNEFYLYALTEIANNFSNQNNPTSSILYYQQAIHLADSLRGKESSLPTRINLAEEFLNKGEYDQALKVLNDVDESYQKFNLTQTYNYIWCLRTKSRVYEEKKDLKNAEDYLLKGLDIASKIFQKDDQDYASIIRRVGEFYLRNNDPELAYKYVAPAIEIIKNVYGDDRIIYAWYAETMSDILYRLDDYAQAVNLLEKAAAIYLRQIGEGKDYIDVQSALGQLFVQLGQFEKSIEALESKRKAVRKNYGRYSIPYMLSSRQIARTYLFWKKPENAYQELKEVKSLSDSLGVHRSYYAEIYNFLGWALLDMNRLDEGKKHYQMAIQIGDSIWGPKSQSSQSYRNNLAFYHLRKGEYEVAEKLWLATKQKEYVSDLSSVNWLDNMAMLYTSWDKLDQAASYWNTINDLLLKAIKEDFPLLSEYGKAAFWDTYKEDFETFNTYAIKAYQKGDTKALHQMYDNQLQTKSLLLNTSTKERKRILNSGNKSLLATYNRYLGLKENLAKYYGYSSQELKNLSIDIETLESQAENLEKALSIDSENEKNARNERNLTWKAVQKTLQPDEAAIEIVRFRYFDKKRTDSIVYAALILTAETTNGPILEVLPNGNYLEDKAIKAYRSAMKFKLKDKRSYSIFWGAIDKHLNKISNVYLSSDGVYHQLNVATLQREDESFINQHYNIRLVSSTRTIVELKKRIRSDQNQTAYIFGNPKFDLSHNLIEGELKERGLTQDRAYTRATSLDDFSFSELPGTKVETETIGDVLSDNQWITNIYLGEDALEEELKRVDNPGILHIATHGFFLDEPDENTSDIQLGVQVQASRKNPLLRSGLLMTGATQTAKGEQNNSIENGIFTAYEAMNLDLSKTELVILSACETGLGEIKNGEGVFGLQRAFQIAGAKSILMSLWKVDDDATQLLMTSFYKAWLNGADEVSALHQAQEVVKVKYPHPNYWGAFVLVGS